MAILGLISTEQFANERYKSARRKVFYDYPQGAAPLTGILSMLKEESASDPEFDWWEKRMREQRTITATIAATGVFGGSGAATTNSWGTTQRTGGAGIDAGGAWVVGDKISIKVASNELFRVGHIVEINAHATTPGLMLVDGTRIRFLARVGQLTGTQWLDLFIITPARVAGDVGGVQGIDNDAAGNVGLFVRVVGSAFAQGAIGSSISPYNLPVNPQNYMQIFRTEFKFTGTALKTSAKFDNTGLYKDRAKEASLNHMIELEKAFLFGIRSKILDASNVPTYTTGGILWWLEQWEKRNIANGGAFDYEPGGSAALLDTDDNKRIITNATGIMTEALFDGYVERSFRVTNNRANEKLVLCGNGSLQVINQLYKSKSVLNSDLPLTDTYGMDVVSHRSPFGKLYYKTHPLFNQDPILRNSMLILDVGNLVYRYLEGRDTDILSDRQANNEDGRTDEWLTECGLESRYPESHMFIQNILSYAP